MSFKKAKTLKNDKINENYFLKTFFYNDIELSTRNIFKILAFSELMSVM